MTDLLFFILNNFNADSQDGLHLCFLTFFAASQGGNGTLYPHFLICERGFDLVLFASIPLNILNNESSELLNLILKLMEAGFLFKVTSMSLLLRISDLDLGVFLAPQPESWKYF